MTEANKHLEPVWREVQSEFGGDDYEVVISECSDVLIVKDALQPYVIKVPKNDAYFSFDQLLTEVNVQDMLMHAVEEPPIKTPAILAYSDQPSYLALEYIPGTPLLDYQAQEVDVITSEGTAIFGGNYRGVCCLDGGVY